MAECTREARSARQAAGAAMLEARFNLDRVRPAKAAHDLPND
jgi:hypothetical protein